MSMSALNKCEMLFEYSAWVDFRILYVIDIEHEIIYMSGNDSTSSNTNCYRIFVFGLSRTTEMKFKKGRKKSYHMKMLY